MLQTIQSKKIWTDAYDQVISRIDDLAVMYDFFQSGDASMEEIDELFSEARDALEDLEFKNMLSSDEDQLGAVMQITSGAGGTESCDWAEMLMRMYLMWGEKNGYEASEQD